MSQLFQGLLDGLGWLLARLYDLVPNYGVAIILLTLMIRVLLLPLAFKQIRSMQSMQALQPKMKELQRKYKGNRQKLNEEVMKLYQEHGVSPFGGCLPLLAQFPVLIALFAVLSFPKGLTHIPHSDPVTAVGRPQDSRLYVDIVNQKTKFLGMNLVCSPREAAQQVQISEPLLKAFPDLRSGPKDEKGRYILGCGSSGAVRVPYYVLLALMIGSTFYQQRQMQRASPGGAQQQQQQMMARIMPLFFGVIGFSFPAGLILYWTTTNAVQIGQQHYMFVRRGMGPDADAPAEGRARSGGLGGLMARLTRASEARSEAAGSKRSAGDGGSKKPPKSGRSGEGGGGSKRTTREPGGLRGQAYGRAKPSASKRTKPGSSPSGGASGGGSRDAGNRKKRRKR